MVDVRVCQRLKAHRCTRAAMPTLASMDRFRSPSDLLLPFFINEQRFLVFHALGTAHGER